MKWTANDKTWDIVAAPCYVVITSELTKVLHIVTEQLYNMWFKCPVGSCY